MFSVITCKTKASNGWGITKCLQIQISFQFCRLKVEMVDNYHSKLLSVTTEALSSIL